jgi:peptidyl-prolyl cis-trans isomerase SurA
MISNFVRRSGLAILIAAAPFAHAKLVDHIVAIVNNEIISLSDAETFKKVVGNGGMVDDALVQIIDPKKLATNRDEMLEFMIDERILDSEVKKKNLEVTIERVEQEIHDLTQKRNITRDQLKEVLKGRGVSFSEYQDYLKKSLERHALIEKEVYSKIRISDEDISSYYMSKKGVSKNQSYEYSLAHILVVPKKGKEEQAKAKALDAYEKLKSGQSFDDVAEHYSEDPSYARGGTLGNFTSGEMQPDVESAVNKLEVGEFSPVVKTKTGYNIFKVVKRTLVSDPKLEAAKDEIRQTLFQDAFKKQFKAWLTEQKEDAFVKINGWT